MEDQALKGSIYRLLASAKPAKVNKLITNPSQP
jgi:hypothetical protein